MASPSTPNPKPEGPFPQPFGDRYELRQLIGCGGMGGVYHARDKVRQTDVAFKVPHPELCQDPVFGELFLHEARAGMRLDHPHLCRIFDFGVVDATPYISMQLLRGRSLSHMLAGERPWGNPVDAADLTHTLARALAYAHSQGVIHRDLKPANILLVAEAADDPDNVSPARCTPVITDFGLALRLDTADALVPRQGEIVGSIPYMPPEQVRPGVDPLGPASDIYSLGVILYEMLTGRVPIIGHSASDLIIRILNDQPEPPSKLRPGIPEALDRICLKALAKKWRERFVCMEEFADALAPILGEIVYSGTDVDPRSALQLVRVHGERVQFIFTGYGQRAPAALDQQNRLFLDVGNALRPGVIDHHHLLAYSGSTAGLVLNRADLLDASVAPGRRGAEEPFIVLLHENPDLDAVAAAYLALSYLTEGRFPSHADLLTLYIDRVDQGSLGMSMAHPFSLYAAYRRLLERGTADEMHWRLSVQQGMKLVAYVLEQAVQHHLAIIAVDAFTCPGLFSKEDRDVVLADRARYERKLADPATGARVARLRLPGQFGGMMEVDALLVRDVQNGYDPERCLYFKDWARTDEGRCPLAKGFAALSVFMSEGPRQRQSCIVSVTPESRASLRGLGAALDEAESVRRVALYGVDNRVQDPVTRLSLSSREGYTNSDPWYDGRAHAFTIIDAPRSGTRLTADEIERRVLHFGGATSTRPL